MLRDAKAAEPRNAVLGHPLATVYSAFCATGLVLKLAVFVGLV